MLFVLSSCNELSNDSSLHWTLTNEAVDGYQFILIDVITRAIDTPQCEEEARGREEEEGPIARGEK